MNRIETWFDKKAFIVGIDHGDLGKVFKLEADYPCADLCKTCQGIFRRKCSTCEDNSVMNGDTCVCKEGYYRFSIGYSKLECRKCSTLCSGCFGGEANQCLGCIDPLMEVKGDGTCGCISGYFLFGAKCYPCDESCSSCSGPGDKLCSDCDQSKGRFFDSGLSSCPKCDPSCQTCSGGDRNQCLSCPAGFFISAGSCLKCHDSCETCSGGGPNSCQSCKTSERRYLKNNQCLLCHSDCLTCDGEGPEKCSSCQEGRYLEGSRCSLCDPSCLTCSSGGPGSCLSCDESAGRYKEDSSCLACHNSCRTCFGGGQNECRSCTALGYFLEGSSCVSCSKVDSENCPPVTIMEIQKEIIELSQNFTIKFKPPLNQNLLKDSLITAQKLTEKHIEVKFKRKGKEEQKLTILEQKLTHKEDNSHSELFIKFLEKMRVENTEKITIQVKDPWIYLPKPEEPQQNLVYIKEESRNITIIKSKQKETEEKEQEQIKKAAETTSTIIATSGTASVSAIALSGGARSSLLYLIKFFNILEIISNLSKMNVVLGSKLLKVITFIQNIKLPTIGFFSKLSPLKDSEVTEKDFDAYQTIPRGTRGKITTENSEIFIASGQNFLFSISIITSWLVMKLLEGCSGPKSSVLNWVTFFYQTLFGIFFFDFQLICSAEIGMMDFTGGKGVKLKFLLSYFLSLILTTLVSVEFLQASSLLQKISKRQMRTKHKERGRAVKIDNQEEKLRLLENMTPCQKMTLTKYTEVLDMDSYGPQTYLVLFENLRFFAIQVIIGSLQLLNWTQATLALLVDLAYFVYFVKMIATQKVFKSSVFMIKTIIQECCILIAMITIAMFSFSENSSFSSSLVYKMLEMVAIVSIIGAAAAELTVLVTSICIDLVNLLKNCLKKGQKNSMKITESRQKRQKSERESNRSFSESIQAMNLEESGSILYINNREIKAKFHRSSKRISDNLAGNWREKTL